MRGNSLLNTFIGYRGKNRKENQKMKTESDVIGLDDEGGLHQVEGERWTSCRMA